MSGTASISWIKVEAPSGVTLDFRIDNATGSLVTVNSVSGVTSFSPSFSAVTQGNSYIGTVNGNSPVTIQLNISGVGDASTIELYKNLVSQQLLNYLVAGNYSFNPISVSAGDDILISILGGAPI